MPRWTRKLTTDWQRQRTLFVDSTRESGTANIIMKKSTEIIACVRNLRTYNTTVRLRVAGNIPPKPTTAWAFSPALPPHHLQHTLEWQVTNFEVFEQAETTSIETVLLKSRWAGHVSRTQPFQDSNVRRTLHWILGQRSTEKAPQEVPQYLPHWPPSMISTCCRLSNLVPHCPPGCLLLRGLLQGKSERETSYKEGPRSTSGYARPDLWLWSL
jgi:hypothetical protein